MILTAVILLMVPRVAAQSPTVITQPRSQNFIQGQNALLSVGVTGAGPFTYQWLLNTTNLANATSPLLFIPKLNTNNSGSYSVIVSNFSGSITSAPANLVITSAPTNLAVVGWGYSAYGETTPPPSLSNNVIALSASAYFSMALKTDGTVVAWGNNNLNQANVPSGLANVVAISAGNSFCLALRSNGTVAAWGFNREGETNVPGGLNNVVAISAGNNHCLALKSDGTITGWGDDTYGQINTPASASNVIAIAAGYNTSLALKGDGTVVGWGLSSYGQATPPAGLSGVVAISAGSQFSVALKGDGTAVAWGYDADGETNVPSGLSGLVSISSCFGGEHTLGLRNDGTIAAWGWDQYGELDTPIGVQSNTVALAAGSIHSLALSGINPPTITNQPLSQTALGGTNITFNVGAIGSPPLSYQWQFAGTNITGATNSSFALTNIQAANAGNYQVVVTSPYGSVTSHVAMLTVPLAITTQPVGGTVAMSGNASFSVAVAGVPPFFTQWFDNGSPIGAATNTTLSLTNVQFGNSGNYQAVITNAYGSITSQVANLVVPPVITANPLSIIAGPGATASFSATASGASPLTYQWFYNGTNSLTGATNSILLLTNVQPANGGGYDIVATDAHSAATSAVATLTVAPGLPIAIRVQGNGTVLAAPNTNIYTIGQSVTLTAVPYRFFAFSAWSDGPTNLSRNITVGTNNQYTAIFTNTVLLEFTFKQWEADFGGTGSDSLSSLRQKTDGGYILGGSSSSGVSGNKTNAGFGGNDFWVVNTDASGNKLWDKSFGGSSDDFLYSLKQTSDGGFILGGASSSSPNTGNHTAAGCGGSGYWLVRLDTNGNKLWDQAYCNTGNYVLRSVQQTSDSGYILGGYGFHNYGDGGFGIYFWVVKTDSGGNQQWNQYYGGDVGDQLNTLQQTSDGGYIFGGQAGYGASRDKTNTGFGGNDYWVVKTDASGTKQWEADFGGNGDDVLNSLQQTSDGGYILGGSSASPVSGNKTNAGFGGYDYWVVKMDSNGNKLWDESFGGANDDLLNSLQQTSDGGYILGGTSLSGISGNKTVDTFGTNDYWIVKIDANGNKQWDQAFGGSSVDVLNSLQQSSDSGYILGGTSASLPSGDKTSTNYGGTDYWVVKLVSRTAPLGAPALLLNGQFYSNNLVVATNGAQFQAQLQTSFANGNIFDSVDGSDPLAGNSYSGPFIATAPFSIRSAAFSADFTQLAQADAVNTLAATTPGGGNISVTSQADPYTGVTTATLTAAPLAGWTFLNWNGDATGTNTNATVVMNGPKSVQAIFGTALNTSVTGSGVIQRSTNQSLYPYSSVVRLFAVPNNGNYFRTWGGAASGAISPLDFTITNANSTVTAIFFTLPANTFALTTLTVGNGSVAKSPQQSNYVNGTSVTLTATPVSGNSFTGWSGDAAGAQNPLNVQMNTNKTVTATFSVNTAPSNLPPSVSITNPVNNAVFVAPTNLTINISASDSDGTVAQVVLFANTNQLAVLTGGSFNYVWTNAAIGTNTFTAIATDNGGLSTTSAPVTVIVQPSIPQVALTSPTNNATYLTNASILVSAIATDADNALAHVELYSQATNAQPILLSAITNPPYNFTWSTAVIGAYTLTARALDLYGQIVTSAPVNIMVAASPTTNPPVFLFSSTNFSVNESNSSVNVTVLNNGDLGGLVSYQTADGTAFGGSGFSGSYTFAQGSLLFAAGQRSTNINIAILDNFINGPDIQFSVQLFNPSAGILGTPATTTVTIHQNDVGGATNSLLTTASPTNQPPDNAQLVVVLTPPAAAGQWRFPWDLAWRNSGDTVSNLVSGNYPLIFKNVSGYLIPLSGAVAVTNGGTTYVTNQYLPGLTNASTNGTGSISVNMAPNSPPGDGWRFIGETAWRAPGSSASSLAPGIYNIEFEPVGGYATPASEGVEAVAGQGEVLTVNYLLASSPPGGAALPAAVVSSLITDLKDYPYGFNGQLHTDAGYGSGVAVRETVVLTAAHMVFDDETQSYVQQAYWSFQEETGVFQPEPLAVRGWYVLSGYAAQRTNDLQIGGYAVDQSSPQSREEDVAALYFLTPAARGGFGGYLASDVVPNPYLTGGNLKMLVGYPVDGSAFGQTVQPGLMYATPSSAVPTPLVQNSNDVYTGSWFLSYPGNSGGPFYVQFNGYYYPAGVYLGTLGSGAGSVSLVRAINSSVVNMINLAASEGDAGTNNTGGGVLTLIAGQGLSAAMPAYVQVLLGPPAAVQAGAGWRLQGDALYGTASNYTRSVTTTNGAKLEFKPLSGWNPPAGQSVQLVAGSLTIISNQQYTMQPPKLVLDKVNGLRVTGPVGITNRVDFRTNLYTGQWSSLRTNVLGAGFTPVLSWPPTNTSSAYYRAVLLP